MVKKSLFVFVGAAMLAVPLFSLAAVINGGVSVSGAIGSVAAPSASAAMIPATCYPFGRSLSIGTSGSDVAGLQNYLKAQGYFNATATGYFGVLTKAAVGRWQAQNNIAVSGGTGSGMFGPLSRGFFIRSCGGNGGNEL